MKQILNKILVGSIFLFLFFVPIFKSSAIMMPVMDESEGGSSGGGGGGSTTVTTTTGGTVYTNQISLTVGLDQAFRDPYTGSRPIRASATSSVSVCSNTSFNLRVTGSIYDSSNNMIVSPKTIFNQQAVGGEVIAKDYNFTAPTTSGVYNMKFEATRYDPSGYALFMNGTDQLTSPMTDLNLKDSNDILYTVSTNYRGRIISAYVGTSQLDPYMLPGLLMDVSGVPSYVVRQINEEVISKTTGDSPFTVGAPEVTVGASATTIGETEYVTPQWISRYSNKCTCSYEVLGINNTKIKKDCTPSAPTASPNISTTIYGKSIIGSEFKPKTDFIVKCDNLP